MLSDDYATGKEMTRGADTKENCHWVCSAPSPSWRRLLGGLVHAVGSSSQSTDRPAPAAASTYEYVLGGLD